MSQYRAAEFMIATGTNNTGKSTLFKGLLKVNARNLIIPANAFDPAWSGMPKIVPKSKFVDDPRDWRGKRKIRTWSIPGIHSFTGSKVLDISEVETDEDAQSLFQFIANTNKGMRKGGLFVDDYRNWIYTKGSVPRWVRKMFNDRRHRELDIFMASHSFQDISGDLIQFSPTMIIFRTTLPPNESVAKKIINFPDMQATIDRVNKIGAEKGPNPHYCEKFHIKPHE